MSLIAPVHLPSNLGSILHAPFRGWDGGVKVEKRQFVPNAVSFNVVCMVATESSCEGVVCRDGAVCVQGRCKCAHTSTDCIDDNDPVCATDDGSCDDRRSSTGQLEKWTQLLSLFAHTAYTVPDIFMLLKMVVQFLSPAVWSQISRPACRSCIFNPPFSRYNTSCKYCSKRLDRWRRGAEGHLSAPPPRKKIGKIF